MNTDKILWPKKASVKQSFPLPSSIIYYIAKNPVTQKFYNTIIQCCKYFFEKNAIIAAKDITNICDEIYVIPRDNKKILSWVKIDVKKITCKIWLTCSIFIDTENAFNSFLLLFPRFYFRLNIVNIFLQHQKSIIFEDFKFLISSAKLVILQNVKIFYRDGTSVPLEKIIGAIPNIKNFKT